jgi:hypothetical protein
MTGAIIADRENKIVNNSETLATAFIVRVNLEAPKSGSPLAFRQSVAFAKVRRQCWPTYLNRLHVEHLKKNVGRRAASTPRDNAIGGGRTRAS